MVLDNSLILVCIFTSCRKDAEVSMEGQFLVRQIYEDEITYNLISAAVNVLRKFPLNFQIPRLNKYCNRFDQRFARQQLRNHGPTQNNR
jgi:hypothetical protein